MVWFFWGGFLFFLAIYFSSLSTVIQAPAYIEWLVTQLVAEATFFLSCLISARVVIVNLILLFLLQIILSRITFNYISFEACLSVTHLYNTRSHTPVCSFRQFRAAASYSVPLLALCTPYRKTLWLFAPGKEILQMFSSTPGRSF